MQNEWTKEELLVLLVTKVRKRDTGLPHSSQWRSNRTAGFLPTQEWQQNKNLPYVTKPNVMGGTRMRLRLSWVQCREDGLGCRRGEISLDDGYTVRQAWVGTSNCCLVILLYFWECWAGIKRYPHTRIIIDDPISYMYINRISRRSTRTLIGISWSTMESISKRLVPIGTREYGWLRWRSWETRPWGIKLSCRHIDPWEYHECDHCLEPLDTISTMSLILRMFHTFTKRTKQL